MVAFIFMMQCWSGSGRDIGVNVLPRIEVNLDLREVEPPALLIYYEPDEAVKVARASTLVMPSAARSENAS